MIPYQKFVSHLIPNFWDITFAYLPQAHNQFVDDLATLASMFKLAKGDDMRQLCIEVCGVPAYCMNIEEWYHDIKAYIKNGEYSFEATDSEKKFIRCMACQFFLSGKVLYKRNHDTSFL